MSWLIEAFDVWKYKQLSGDHLITELFKLMNFLRLF